MFQINSRLVRNFTLATAVLLSGCAGTSQKNEHSSDSSSAVAEDGYFQVVRGGNALVVRAQDDGIQATLFERKDNGDWEPRDIGGKVLSRHFSCSDPDYYIEIRRALDKAGRFSSGVSRVAEAANNVEFPDLRHFCRL